MQSEKQGWEYCITLARVPSWIHLNNRTFNLFLCLLVFVISLATVLSTQRQAGRSQKIEKPLTDGRGLSSLPSYYCWVSDLSPFFRQLQRELRLLAQQALIPHQHNGGQREW